jgi:hypothetical protein
MLPKSMPGIVLATLVVVGCGGRRIVTQAESPGTGGSGDEGISGGGAGGGAGAGGKAALCHLGDVPLAEGQTAPRDDCNICLCQWSGEVVCTDKPCPSGSSGDGGPGSCALTRQLALSSAGVSGDLRVGATVSIDVMLANQGPLDHYAYPGVELAIDSPYFVPAGGAAVANNALYGLAADSSAQLGIPVIVRALPPPCSQILFHLQTISFGEKGCRGASLEVPVVLPLPSNENCPACPPSLFGSPAACLSGMSCGYSGGVCNCTGAHWDCAYDLH